MTDVQVSIIIPVYNTEKYLHECLDSVIAQTIFNKTEIILVDDGSPDKSPQICDEFAMKFTNISVIHQKNAGVSAARNAGIKKAQGKFIGFVDSDDCILADMFEQLLIAAEHTNADMSFCGFVLRYPEAETRILYPFPEKEAMDKNYILSGIYPFLLKEETLNSCWNKLFRKTIIDEKQIMFPVNKKNGEDRCFLFDYLANSHSLVYVPYAAYCYRFVQNSATKALNKSYIKNITGDYEDDIRRFGNLGFEPEIIEYNSGTKLLKCALAGIYLAMHQLKGKDKRDVIKDFFNNGIIRNCLKLRWNGLIKNCSRYERILFFMMRIKSVSGIRAAVVTMDWKNDLARGKIN
jgi:glycosyltransferase involved in cell wall biosynthesis